MTLHAARAHLGPPQAARPTTGIFPTRIDLPARPRHDAVTRAYNVAFACAGLVALSPLLGCLALAVKLSSRGPVLYRGARLGRDGEPFTIYKFRTMKVGAEALIGKRLVRLDEDHFTPIGKGLRRYGLDEFAQLFNVLRGDMNLVGPRPVRPIFLADHDAMIPGYRRRFLVRPGLTGLAQLRGHYHTPPRHKLFYETLYVARRSVGFDLRLIAQTGLRFVTGLLQRGPA
jgi:lipopolysaccharide/colanic/teichoic acid biosynthesis glycosyltransferase